MLLERVESQRYSLSLIMKKAMSFTGGLEITFATNNSFQTGMPVKVIVNDGTVTISSIQEANIAVARVGK